MDSIKKIFNMSPSGFLIWNDFRSALFSVNGSDNPGQIDYTYDNFTGVARP